ncbi:MAG TPA: PQQ-binding-like beta-propeller repeat protein [Gemmataceae bacterium]|nr:PQQ-binding-like beta-propeller repeat protein [Gemmataceae bacterium]
MTVSVIATIALFAVGSGADWPQFRGPTGQGLAPDAHLPTDWGPARNVAWKKDVPGVGWSSPVVGAGRIYLTTAVAASDAKATDYSLRTLCLDAKTGDTVWDVEVFLEKKGTPKPHPKNSHASPTPILDGERLFVHYGHMGTACLDLNGKVLWRNSDLKYSPVHGNGGTPILEGDEIIFSADGGDKQFVAALVAKTGKLRWKTDRKPTSSRKFSFSTPLAIDVKGKREIVSPGPGGVVAYDPKNGDEIWRCRYGEGYSVIPRPVFGHGLVYVSSSYDQPVLYAVLPDGTGDVTKKNIVWTLKKGAPHTPSPLLVGDELYVAADNGLGSCVDAKTGKVHWQQRLGSAFSASPLYADGKIYFQTEDGVGIVVKAGTKYEPLARNELGEKTLASYGVVGNAILLRTEHHLYRIEGGKE